METLEEARLIISIIAALLGLLFVTIIPTIIKFVQTYKKYKAAQAAAEEAKTEAERIEAEAEAEKVKNELLDMANNLIKEAEITYKNVDTILKQQTGKGSGAVKKDSVMTKLQAACLEKGVEFDSDYWNSKIDELVEMTKEVNTKKGA